MKLNPFLSVVSLFVVLHLCKAGPLRLQKRAVFYIANETACVVDNIVYSNGDPIPTDDPCEACKCRPPGFACVLKECKVKPGCKAVRRVGQCCPDYICGCEHNGRMYNDGEEIRDPKNPCYECHCQGSSIACSFVDCFFRYDCDGIYVPGECCPKYENCTRDVSEINQFPKDNALPPVNLLTALNDVPVLPEDLPTTTQTPEPSDSPTNPLSNFNEASTPEDEESVKTREPQTADKVIEKVKEELEENKNDEIKLQSEDTFKVNEEIEKLFNSEAEIKSTDHSTSEVFEPTKTSVEKTKEEPTTVSNELVEDESVETLEKTIQNDSSITKIQESEKQIQNSAADNGKSLKISDDEQLEDVLKEEESKADASEAKRSATVTDLEAESLSETQTEITKESSKENEPEYQENENKEAQPNSKVTSFYSNDDKIKSESAETVTIVVHVREKAKPSTEKDLVTEKVTESETYTTSENLLKSQDELKTAEITKEPSKDEVVLTDKNTEIFTTELNKEEPTTNPPMTELLGEKVEERSDEAVIENSTSEKKISELKNEDSLTASTTQNIQDASQEVTPSETTEDTKTNEPMVTIRMDPNSPLKIKIISESGTTILKIKEAKESETKEEEKTEPVENYRIKDELKVDIEPEGRDEPTSEIQSDDTTSAQKHAETATEGKYIETTTAGKYVETTTEKDAETPTGRYTETTTGKYTETTPAQEIKETSAKEKKSTSTEKSEETPVEKVKESKSVDSTRETDKKLEGTEKSQDIEQTFTTVITKTEKYKHDEIAEQTTTTEVPKIKIHKHHKISEHTTTTETPKIEKHHETAEESTTTETLKSEKHKHDK